MVMLVIVIKVIIIMVIILMKLIIMRVRVRVWLLSPSVFWSALIAALALLFGFLVVTLLGVEVVSGRLARLPLPEVVRGILSSCPS